MWTKFIHGRRLDVRYFVPSGLCDMIEMCSCDVCSRKWLGHIKSDITIFLGFCDRAS